MFKVRFVEFYKLIPQFLLNPSSTLELLIEQKKTLKLNIKKNFKIYIYPMLKLYRNN